MTITTEKTKYNFYISYWESFNALTTDKEKVEFITIINKIHFFEEHIENIEIKNPNVKLLFVSIKHSIKSSIQGYCDKQGLDYDNLFKNTTMEHPCQPPCQAPIEPPCQQYIIDNKKDIIDNKQYIKEKDKYGQFNNVLLTKEEYTKLQELYSNKLNEAIDFLSSSIESKGYKYKSHYAVMGKSQWVYKKIFEEKQSNFINKKQGEFTRF